MEMELKTNLGELSVYTPPRFKGEYVFASREKSLAEFTDPTHKKKFRPKKIFLESVMPLFEKESDTIEVGTMVGITGTKINDKMAIQINKDHEIWKRMEKRDSKKS